MNSFFPHDPSSVGSAGDEAATAGSNFLGSLARALDAFDRERVAALCADFVRRLRGGAAPPSEKQASEVLSQLRRKRHFSETRSVADALIAAGQNAPRVRRMLVQALLDEGDITAGLAVAEQLLRDEEARNEWAEARGLVGRAYKQRWVATRSRRWLEAAIDAYLPVFEDSPPRYLWHGINAAALLSRAASDFGGIHGKPAASDLAQRILRIVGEKQARGTIDTWTKATAMEAAVALGDTNVALHWARDYVHSPGADAFELASTLRQLKEIWQLDKHSEPGSLLLPLLEAELLRRHGGVVPLAVSDMDSDKATQLNQQGRLEKVFGTESYLTWEWYRQGLHRCRAVARIETETGQGVGTGFLVYERDFLSGDGSGALLLTNAHVLSRDGSGQSLAAMQAYLRFQAVNDSLQGRYRVQQIVQSSAPVQLDFTLARLDRVVAEVEPLPVSQVAPDPSKRQRLYAIGHPLGSSLSFSLHDNHLLDFKDPQLHYRTPTDPGSSGSPIFDDQWRLVALHCAGDKQMPRLHGDGVYEANRGVWIKAVQRFCGQGGVHASAEAATAGFPRAPVAVGYQSLKSSPGSPPRSGVRKSTMNTAEKQARLQGYVHRITTPDRLETLRHEAPEMAAAAPTAMESLASYRPEPTPEDAERAVALIQQGQQLGDAEMFAMEAIVLPRERPVVFIEENTFKTPESPWTHFVEPANRTNIERAIRSIGRVELPDNVSIPFGGTAFVVGPRLLMTNRHVAELFAAGLGSSVMFRSGQTAGWDYRRELRSPPGDGTMLKVERIVMIHPFWDMALLQVAGLTAAQTPLRLSVTPPEGLAGREVAVVGYPAKDWRNDSELQDRIFKRTYNVKRLQPGKIVGSDTIRSFEHNVAAMTHDSSTLGGNSGSAVLDVKTGEIVGLHFAGLYLKANYAVPAYELARDGRVVEAGVQFVGSAPSNPDLDRLWRRISTVRPPQPVRSESQTLTRAASATSGTIRIQYGSASVTIPFDVSPASAGFIKYDRESAESDAPTAPLDVLEAIKPPVIFPRLNERKGYSATFLRLPDNQEVPLPHITEAGERIVARLDGGSSELKYHHFSVVMHKKRRLALFTAANVDWRDKVRKINGKKPTRQQLNGFTRNDRELWVTDERIPETHQLPDLFFTKDGGAFDRGHLVRRDDVCWGKSFQDMQKGNGDTFHTTNCSPQVAGFNRSSSGEDNWGDLENMIQQQAVSERVTVFSGPVLDDDDLRYEGRDKRGEVLIQIPRRYWKIVVAAGDRGPEAFGFVQEQDLSDVELEFALPSRWRQYMRPISEIEQLLFGNATLEWLKQHDQFETTRGRRLAARARR